MNLVKDNVFLFTLIYTFIVIALIVCSQMHYEFPFIIFKVILGLLLLFDYMTSVPKEKWEKLYFIFLGFIFFGQLSFYSPETYIKSFNVLYYAYLLAHLVLTIRVYSRYLIKESKKDILLFAVPFVLLFIVMYTFLDFPSITWKIKGGIMGCIVSLHGSVVLINYSNKSNIKNYLLFMGVFTLFLVEALAAVFMWHEQNELFYSLVITLDAMANFMICRSLSIQKR